PQPNQLQATRRPVTNLRLQIQPGRRTAVHHDPPRHVVQRPQESRDRAANREVPGQLQHSEPLIGKKNNTPMDNRRAHPRLKTKVPIELYVGDSQNPIRGATADISLTGCYIETIFPMSVGTNLELRLRLDDTPLVLETTDPSR